MDIDVLVRAHDENERLGLGLTPEQIIAALDRHQGQQHSGRPKRGRRVVSDPTGDAAAARADRARRGR